MALYSFPQVLGSKGVHELRSSTSALHNTLEEAASLLSMFWRAALPSAPGPVLPAKVVRSQCLLLVPTEQLWPQDDSFLLAPQLS